VNISAPLICERAEDKVDVSWQLSLHPGQDPIAVIARTDVAGGLTYTGMNPIGPSMPLAKRLASLPR